MKIEHVQPIKNIPDKQQPQLFRRGEFFVSEVLEVRGETALLKSAQGTLLTAKLLGNLGLSAGDHVETVVDEALGNRYVLRLLDVSRGDGQTANGAADATANTAAQSIRAQTLHGMLAMLKKNAGLEPKMAEFMARNGIPDTPENIETIVNLVKGEMKTGQALLHLQGETARAETASTNMAASLAQNRVFELSALPSAAAQPPAGTAAAAASAFTAAEPLSSPNSTAVDSSAGQPQQISTLTTDNAIPQVALQTEQSAEAAVTKLPADTAGPQANTSVFIAAGGAAQQEISAGNGPVSDAGLPVNTPTPATLAKQLLSLFVDLNDKKTLPDQLKKTMEELPEQIKELKISLKPADINDRNTLARQAESLDRQFTLMSELKRFDCYHIPLTGRNNEPATAELYVFRQKRRKADADPEAFAVLLGLDTQHMGRVEAMIRAAGRSVTLEFRLEMAELTDAFEQGARALEPLIAQAGYRLTGVNVQELAVKTTVLNAEDALSQGKTPDTGGLDIRV